MYGLKAAPFKTHPNLDPKNKNHPGENRIPRMAVVSREQLRT
jgi:hypothetical protein